MEETRITVPDPGGQPTGIFGRRGEPGSQIMSIFDPETQPTMSFDKLPNHISPLLETLENKTVYLVDTGFAGTHEFPEEVRYCFTENMPEVKTVLHVNK